MFIHEIENWTLFRWNANRLSEQIARTNRTIGYLAGRLSTIGFDNQIRYISYILNYIVPDSKMFDFTDSAIINRDGKDYISTVYREQKTVEERISPLDKIRFEQNEMSIDDLVYKYFAYLSESKLS